MATAAFVLLLKSIVDFGKKKVEGKNDVQKTFILTNPFVKDIYS